MSKLKNLFKSKPVADVDETTTRDAPPPDVKGHDAKAIAEIKADEAGAKWRADAEAKGEIAKEVGGPKGLEPTRYGDWEKAGRCSDF